MLRKGIGLNSWTESWMFEGHANTKIFDEFDRDASFEKDEEIKRR